MALKFMNSLGNGSSSDAIECINYAIQKRAHIINASWGFGAFSQTMREAIAAARNQGIAVVVAADNNYTDIDALPRYPASYDVDNIITVAATTRTDSVPPYSNVGLVSVHLAAPGGERTGDDDPSMWPDAIYSTGNTSDSAYRNAAGTSMAAPHVAGALALMKSRFVESYTQLKNRLLSSTDPLSSLFEKCQTGGRLNLNKALSTTFWRPTNNNFASAFTIRKPASSSAITFVANNVDATKETSEPNHAGNAGGKSVWWNWIAPDNNSVTFTTKGSGLDTVLAVYTGSSVSGLTLVASDNDSDLCGTSQVTFTPVSGTTYRIAVDGYNGAQGAIKLTLQDSSTPAPTPLRFTLTTLQRSSGQFQATITGPAWAEVRVDWSDALPIWPLPNRTTVYLDGNGSGLFVDTSATTPARFYRAKIEATGQDACNAVGYADVSMAGGVTKMIANPFNAVDNKVTALMPTPSSGTTVWKYNPATGDYISIQYFSGSGWEGDDLNMTLNPGEGVQIQTTSNWAKTFVGEIAQRYGVNMVDNGITIRSSIVPQAGRVTSDLHLPVIHGDTVTKMVNGSQVTYTYNLGVWSPEEPSVEIGESFWNNKNVGFWWHRNFLVWP